MPTQRGSSESSCSLSLSLVLSFFFSLSPIFLSLCYLKTSRPVALWALRGRRRVPARWKRVSSRVCAAVGSAMTPRKNRLEKSANAGRFLKEGTFLWPGEAEKEGAREPMCTAGDFTKLVYHHGILSCRGSDDERTGRTRSARNTTTNVNFCTSLCPRDV